MRRSFHMAVVLAVAVATTGAGGATPSRDNATKREDPGSMTRPPVGSETTEPDHPPEAGTGSTDPTHTTGTTDSPGPIDPAGTDDLAQVTSTPRGPLTPGPKAAPEPRAPRDPRQANLAAFARLAGEFVYVNFAFSPTSATQAGLHRGIDAKTGQEASYDELLDDFSAETVAKQRKFYAAFKERLKTIRRAELDPQTQVDYDLLDNAARFALFSLDEEQFHRRKPQNYMENLGTALFAPMSLEYADKNARAAHLAARLERVPAFVDQALLNLAASNEVYRKVALESNEGVVALVRELGAEFVRGTPSEERFARAAPPALAALERFAAFVRDELPKREQVDWRMGSERFAHKWRYYLQVSFTPAEMLEIAERGMRDTRDEMLRLAEPLHEQWFPGHAHERNSTYLNAVVGEVLDRIQAEHTSREKLVEQTLGDADEITAFIRKHRVVSMTSYPNLRIIPTPEFMRASYGIAGAVFAPALEPQLSTFYWVTPIPDAWSDEMAAGRLREYNRYKMLQLTVHEALPGHAVQGLYANLVTPEWRRLLRNIYGNMPYVEGWAVYAEHMMEEMGLNGGDPVKMRLVALKGMLRVYANAVIDIRLHTKGLAGEDAVRLMTDHTFQERPEATGKLQRAQLDYVQLNTYLAGWREWTALRREVERREGERFDLARFHDTVLLYGAIPVPKVAELYLAGVKPTAKPL